MSAWPSAAESLITWLDPTAAETPALGGKARGLVRLLAAGLPVPPGFVLQAEALPAPPAGVAAPPLPAEAAAALGAAYAALGRALGEAEPCVAVRSSALAEDLAQASFAGQYLTVLGVRGEQALLEAAARCWASLEGPGVAAYRAAVEARTGQPLPPPGMALLVQALIGAEVAGVAETADPVDGATEHVLVRAAWGLGRAVVEGLVEPDTWRVARADGTPRELRVGDKPVRVLPAQVEPQPVPEDLRRRPCLTWEQATQIAQLALQAEVALGSPVDVEWALADGALWLLQARPLVRPSATAAAEASAEPPGPIGPSPAFPFVWPDADAPKRHWSRLAEDRRAFELFPPFELEARRLFVRCLQRGAWEAGMPEMECVLEANGYMYYAKGPTPGDDAERARRRETYARPIRALQARGESLTGAVLIPDAQAGTQRLAAIAPDTLSNADLAAHLEEALAWYEHVFTLHFSWEPWDEQSPIGRAGALYRALTGDEDRRALFKPFAHVPCKDGEAVAGLIALARRVQQSPALAALFRAHAAEGVLERLDEVEGGAEFRAALDALLAVFGLHCGASQGTLRNQILPGWGEQPSLVIALVQRYAALDLAPLEEAQRRAAAQYPQDLAAVRQRVVAAGASAAQLEEFDFWFAATQRMIREAVDHNYTLDSPPAALLHRALMACARRLVGAGVLERVEDVWWLWGHQIAAALRSLDAPTRPDWRALLMANKALYAWQQSLTPPPYLGAPPTPLAPAARAGEAPPAGLLVQGQPGAPGMVTGRVRLADYHALLPDVGPGDVLVAENCGALWAAALPTLAAVVLEGSGPGEHALRVCNEFGIPGVVQAHGATRRLHEAQRVTVDGTHGWVLAVKE